MKDPFTDTGPAQKVTRRRRESPVEKYGRKRAKDLGFWCRKFKSPGKRSAPDDIFCRAEGTPFFIEFKAPGVEPSDKQLDEHAEMRKHGCRVYVCDSKEAVDFVFHVEAHVGQQ